MKLLYTCSVFLALLFQSGKACSQTTADSLKALLKQQNLNDSARVDILNNLAWNLNHKTPKESLKYAQEALELSKKIHYLTGEGNAHNTMGINATTMGEYTVALQNFIAALEIWDKTGDALLKANTINNIGNVNQLQGDLVNAKVYFLKALKQRLELNDTNAIYASYNSVALIYKEQKQLDTAMMYFKKFLLMAQVQHNDKKVSGASNNIGMIFRNMKEYDSALFYFQQALSLKKKIHDEQGLALSYRNIGDVYQFQHKYARALEYYKQSLAIRRKIGYNFGLTILLKDMAYMYIEMGDTQQAKGHALQSVEVARASKMKAEEAEALKALADVFEAQGNYTESLQTYRAHVSLKDSLFNIDKARQLDELQVKYKTEQHEKELLAKSKAIEILELKNIHDYRIKVALGIASLLLVGLVILFFNRYTLKKKSEKETIEKNKVIELKNSEIEMMNAELEKRMLRAQMDPHFIFNSLNSIQHFITINDKRSTLKYLSKFSKLIRRVLDSSVSTVVTLDDEIQLLKNYIELEALRLNNSFDYSFSIDPSLDVNYVEVPFLLLQPYVENAIQHGLRTKNENGRLLIRFIDKDEFIRCEIEDNGIGRAASGAMRHEHHRSYGMSVTSQRLERLNQNYAQNALAIVEDLVDNDGTPSGTKVTLTIPKHYEQSTFALTASHHHSR